MLEIVSINFINFFPIKRRSFFRTSRLTVTENKIDKLECPTLNINLFEIFLINIDIIDIDIMMIIDEY